LTTLQMHKDLHNELLSLGDPWKYQGYKSVVNRAPAPSRLSTVATTRWTSTNWVVAASRTTQISLFPGHGSTDGGVDAQFPINSVDTQAFHARPMFYSNGGTNVSPNYVSANIAPYPYTANYNGSSPTLPGLMGFITAAGSELPSTFASTDAGGLVNSTTNASWLGMAPDVPLPLVGADGVGHSRWRCVSAGITIKNVTVVANRGGSIVTVLPDKPYYIPGGTTAGFTRCFSQSLFERFKSYTVHGASAKVSMNLRPEDQAFWHTYASIASSLSSLQTSSLSAAGIHIWLNSDGSQPQNYEISVIFNWELSGYFIEPVAESTIHQPGAHGIMERVSQKLQTQSGAAGAHQAGVSAMIANAAEQGFGAVKQVAVAGAGFVHDVGKAITTGK